MAFADLGDYMDNAEAMIKYVIKTVEPHIEGLDLLGVVGDEDGALEHLLGEVALVLGLEVGAPLHLKVKLVVVGTPCPTPAPWATRSFKG